MSFKVSRRAVVAGGLALAACNRTAESAPALPTTPVVSLKADAPFPLGVCAQTSHFKDKTWLGPALKNFSQLTPEWEMKMEYIVQDDGSLKFDAPDEIVAFCGEHGLRLYGTTLVWYLQKPKWFEGLTGEAFGKAYDDYIRTVVTRYRGKVVGWDVVNEAVAEDGNGWRPSLWAERLGDFDHMRRAFEQAKAADPDVPLFINDYNLEYLPRKLDTFQRLVERLLASGAPVSGIGCQTHTWASMEPGQLKKTIQALARFGLPVHISELEVSLIRGEPDRYSREEYLKHQGRVYAEVAEAFAELPEKQRFALTLWGLRDKDSWLVKENAGDAPLLFDDAGRPKPVASAFAAALKGLSK
jgi:endo-1,4-beta-xylanase